MFCYNLISVYCPVPYYSRCCQGSGGGKLAFNRLFHAKRFSAHRIFMGAKEGRLVQRQGRAHPSCSKAAASVASIGFGGRLLSGLKAVFDSACFLPHRVPLPRTSSWGVFQKDALDAPSGGVLALARPSPSGTCEIEFRFSDLIMTLISLPTALKNSLRMKGTYRPSSAHPEHTQPLGMC